MAEAVAIKADLSDQPGIDRLIAEVRAQAQEIDLYVHCAALAVAGGLEINPDDLRKAVNVNAISVVPIVQGLRSALRKGSNIVYISSIGAQRYVPSYIALGPTKALGEMLIKYIAKELAPDGIRANIVAAGPVDTPAFRKMFGDDYKSRLAAAAEINPSKRNIEFADIVAAVELVTSPAAVMLQGQVVRTDGGLYL